MKQTVNSENARPVPSAAAAEPLPASLAAAPGLLSGPKRPPADYLRSVPGLPPTPTLLLELLAVFRQPDTDVDRVVNLIAHEPAVTAEILKRCNSVFFGGQEPTLDIYEAVSRLGFYEIYTLVASLFGSNLQRVPGAAAVLEMDAFWRHSVAVAVAAAAIADELGESRPLAFTTGLLHDVGRLVLASAERRRYAQLLSLLPPNHAGLVAAERAAFGTDHAELGGELMARWNLPPEIAQCVRLHHNLAAAQAALRPTAIVQLADLLGSELCAPDPDDPRWLCAATPALEALGYDARDLPRLIALADEGLEKVKGLLQV